MATTEQKDNYQGWLLRECAAQRRVDAGRYGYTDRQDEEEGISLASIHDELGQLAYECKFTDKELNEMEDAVGREWAKLTRKRRSR